MKKIIIGLALISTLAYTSCKSLEVAPPNAITDEQVRELLATGDATQVTNILNSIGSGLETYLNYSGVYTGYSSYPQNSQIDQELIRSMLGNDAMVGALTSTGSNTHRTYYELTVPFTNLDVTKPYWNMPVDFYTAANKALNFITADVVAQNPSLRVNRANALTLRAWGYLNLIERFAPAYALKPNAKGLPIYTQYRMNPVAQISSAKTVYENIIAWLEEAVQLYKDAGVGYTDAVDDYDLGVAQYMLMRAAIEFTDWKKAQEVGEELTAHYTKFIAEANYGAKKGDLDAYVAGTKEFNAAQNAFLSTNATVNPEVILGFAKGSPYNKGGLLYSLVNVFAVGEGGSGTYQPRIDTRLLNKIDDRDFRGDIFTDHAVTYTYIDKGKKTKDKIGILKEATLKWAATQALGETERNEYTYSDDVCIRSSEVYLMLAEAYAQQGKDADAKNTLNTLLAARTKASATAPLTCDNYTSMSGMTTLQMVQLQTRIEMWLEKGLEFYNNKRWNIAVDRTGSDNHYNTGKLSVDEMTLEVPRAEQTANTNWSK